MCLSSPVAYVHMFLSFPFSTAHGTRYDEVLVGAPMYTDFNNVNVETGRVYIFKNTGVSGITCTAYI